MSTAIEIIHETAKRHRIGANVLRGREQRKILLPVRMEIVQRLSVERRLTAGQIGRLLGNRTNNTIFHYLNRERRLRRQRPAS